MNTNSDDALRQRAEALHRLHDGPHPLVVVNAWDAVSARVIEEAGAPTIATSSAGIAWSLGYGDGERLPRAELLAACARICRVTRLPVSVDLERGFGDSAGEVCELFDALIDLGVVGLNIEDGLQAGGGALRPVEIVCERIAALRELAERRGVRLFVNARTDAYFGGVAEPAARFDEALQRARRFAASGADGVFVPGLDRLDEIRRFAAEIGLPLNVYAGYPGVPEVNALAAAGVRRVSLGCGPLQSALGLLARITTESLKAGRYEAMLSGMASAAAIDRLFAMGARSS